MFTPAYPIETARLRLRPVRDQDLDDLYAYHRDAEALRYMYWEARTLDETRGIVGTAENANRLEGRGGVSRHDGGAPGHGSGNW